MPQIVWITGPDGMNIFFNQHWMDYTGLTREESLGHGWNKPFHPEDQLRAREAWQHATATTTTYSLECRLRRADGAYRWWLIRGVPQRDAAGSVLKWLGTCTDIDDLKQAEFEISRTNRELKRQRILLQELNAELEARVGARTAELNLARNEAEQASRAKSSFLAAMSHEIRTPMNGVIGMIEVLHQTSLKGYQVEMIDLIRDSAFSLLTIIEDILDFSKIEAGKLQVDNEPMHLADMVEKACGMLDHLAIKRGVRMTVFVDPALPGMVSGDANRLRQVLVNLASNAIKFCGGGDEPGRVSVRVLLVENRAQAVTVDLIVADDGIGMSEETLGQLFTPFSQADLSTTRRFGGTGLGLAITDMLVRLMGGEITVRSTLGQGSTFGVRLHLARADAVADDTPAPISIAALRCRIVGGELPLGDDLATYLTQGGAVVERSTHLAAACAAEPAAGCSQWLILPGEPGATHAELLAMTAGRPDANIRFIVLGWGRRRRPRAKAIDFVTLDADSLPRNTLFRALALAAGRTNDSELEGDARSQPSHAVQPSRLDARQQGRLILVVEDNETNRIVILQQLRLSGLAADFAVDGKEALTSWRSGDYALVLTDLHMPKMDGYALAAAIRAEEAPGRRTPIIALTANAVRDEELHCLAAGMDGYLSKPVRMAQLKAVIEGWLGPQEASTVGAARLPADLSVLVGLVGTDPQVIQEVLHAFLASAAEVRGDLDEGARSGSMHAVAAAAHKLKSAARSVGALRLGDMCDEIEGAAVTQRASALKTLLPPFHTELAAVQDFLEAR